MTYRDISIITGRSVLLVDDWNDLERRVDIHPRAILAVEAAWGTQLTNPVRMVNLLTLHTSVGRFVVEYEVTDDGGRAFADILDSLAELVGGAR